MDAQDRKWIKRIQHGETELLERIVEKYYDDLYRFCRYKTNDAHGSYDIVQETFLRFIRYVEQYRYQNLKGYLLTIASHVCADEMKKRSRESLLQTELQRKEAEECLYQGKMSAEEAGGKEEQLQKALLALPEIQREVLVLKYYHGMKIREIAGITGTSAATVKSRLFQGKKKLKELLVKEGYHEEGR